MCIYIYIYIYIYICVYIYIYMYINNYTHRTATRRRLAGFEKSHTKVSYAHL